MIARNYLASRLWAMEEKQLQALASLCDYDGDTDLKPQAVEYQVINGIAVVPVTGVLTKYADIWTLLFGGTSTVELRVLVNKALADARVHGVMLFMDSPGGEVSGTGDLAEAIAEAEKPVWAYCSDCCASGAYWIASQCDRIAANTTASVGCIGVYTILSDTSQLYQNAGVKNTLIKAGAYKGIGADGVAIDSNQVADVQREVDEIYELFVEAVALGRSISESKALALSDGRAWIASKAIGLGLIDQINSFEEVLNEMAKEIGTVVTDDVVIEGQNAGGVNVSADQKALEAGLVTSAELRVEGEPVILEAKVETIADPSALIEAVKTEAFKAGAASERSRLDDLIALAGSRPAFVMEQFKAGADKATAAIAYAAQLEKELNSKAMTHSDGAQPIRAIISGDKTKESTKEQLEREFDALSTAEQKQWGTAETMKKNFIAYHQHIAKAQ